MFLLLKLQLQQIGRICAAENRPHARRPCPAFSEQVNTVGPFPLLLEVGKVTMLWNKGETLQAGWPDAERNSSGCGPGH